MPRRSYRCDSVAVAMLLLALTVGAASQAPVQAESASVLTRSPLGTATIRGRVVSAGTGAPIRHVQVNLNNTDGRWSGGPDLTDAQGRFEFAQLPAGRFLLSASASGYVPRAFGESLLGESGTPIDLIDGQVMDKVELALVRGGAISGRIVDETGGSLAGATVTVQRVSGPESYPGTWGPGHNGQLATTDDRGQFRIYGLAPGDYYVTARFASQQRAMTGHARTVAGYAATYYPGTATESDARRVAVESGQEVEHITFAMSAVSLARISGRVTSGAGRATSTGFVSVKASDKTGAVRENDTPELQPDGTFQTRGLPPGTYTILARAVVDIDRGVMESARLEVSLNGESVDDVHLVTGPGGILRGSIASDDGSPLPFGRNVVQVQFLSDEQDGGLVGASLRRYEPDDWTFELNDLHAAGQIRAFVMEPGSAWMLKSAWQDGVDLADTAIDLAAGNVVSDVEVVLTRKITAVEGVVTDERGQPAADATVLVFTDNRAQWARNSRYLRLERPNSTGHYSRRLTPTTGYRAIAVRGIGSRQVADPDFLTRALQHATPFDVAEGETRILNLTVVEVK